MKRKKEIKIVSFNGKYYVKENAVKEGTFEGEDYGEGLYFQNPAQVLAYTLIMENKEMLMNKNKSSFKKDLLLNKIDSFIDFPEDFSKEDFFSAVKKTLSQKQFNPNDFMKKLEANIDMKKDTEYSHSVIKNVFVNRIRNALKIDKNTSEQNVILQIFAIETPPEGYSKIELFTCAMDNLNAQENLYKRRFYELFEGVNFLDDKWFEKLIESVKEQKTKKNDEEPLTREEEIDKCYHMKSIHVSLDNMIEVLANNSTPILTESNKKSLKKDKFNESDIEEIYLS